MQWSRPSILLLLSVLICVLALLASNPDTALVAASPYPSTNPFDRIIHILRRKISDSSEEESKAGARDAGATATITVYLPTQTDQATQDKDDYDGFADAVGSGSGPRFTQSNGGWAFGEGMGDVLASEAHDASPLASSDPHVDRLASANAQPEPRFLFTHQASAQDGAHPQAHEDADHLDYSVVAAAHAHASVVHGVSAAAMMSRGQQPLVDKEAMEDAKGLFEIEDHAEESLFALADLVDGSQEVDGQFSLQDGMIAESLEMVDFV